MELSHTKLPYVPTQGHPNLDNNNITHANTYSYKKPKSAN